MNSYFKYTVVTCLMSLLMVSCGEEFLDNPPVGAFTEDNYIRNIDELETILYSCYSVLNAYHPDAPIFAMSFQQVIFGNIGSDDSEKGSAAWDSFYDLDDISISNQAAGSTWLIAFWMIHYDLIGKCNLVIDKAVEISVSEDQLDDLEKIVDQAKFMRALGYYHLVTLFGDIPLITHWLDDTKKMKFERAPKAQVWELIIQDLKDASNLPLKSQTEFGRISHGAVYALLGKVYMWLEEYQFAVDAYTAVIESGEYQLVDDYGLIQRYEGEDCSESILEFQEEKDVDGGHVSTWTGVFIMPRDDPYGWGFDIPTQDLVDEFEEGDPRLLYSVTFIGDVFPAPWGQFVAQNFASATGYNGRKGWIPWDERELDNWYFAKNWRYCRYAEVLLFCAEALNETNQAPQALTYLNKVRERARDTPKVDPQRISSVWDSTYIGELLPDVTTMDQAELREAIWHEQRVELAQEGHRRWILLRTKRFKERMETAKAHLGCTVEDYELLLPIPDIDVRESQGRIIQNPGYN